MVLTTRPDQSFQYVTDADRALPPQQQTTWTLRLLTPKQRAWLSARSGKNYWDVMDPGCQAALMGWDNLRDPYGAEVAYEEEPISTPVCGDSTARASVVAKALLDIIPPTVRIELVMAALNGAVMTEEDAGN